MEHDPHRNPGDVYRPVPWGSTATWVIVESALSRVVGYISSVLHNLEHVDFQPSFRMKRRETSKMGYGIVVCSFHPRRFGSFVRLNTPGVPANVDFFSTIPLTVDLHLESGVIFPIGNDNVSSDRVSAGDTHKSDL